MNYWAVSSQYRWGICEFVRKGKRYSVLDEFIVKSEWYDVNAQDGDSHNEAILQKINIGDVFIIVYSSNISVLEEFCSSPQKAYLSNSKTPVNHRFCEYFTGVLQFIYKNHIGFIAVT